VNYGENIPLKVRLIYPFCYVFCAATSQYDNLVHMLSWLTVIVTVLSHRSPEVTLVSHFKMALDISLYCLTACPARFLIIAHIIQNILSISSGQSCVPNVALYLVLFL